uniref:Uncharacterized protein n=1 Tax=Hyaloperonospora arabidopsidis (strain Emoy2) TaxID=559515 RepID=M4C559_HYAAE
MERVAVPRDYRSHCSRHVLVSTSTWVVQDRGRHSGRSLRSRRDTTRHGVGVRHLRARHVRVHGHVDVRRRRLSPRHRGAVVAAHGREDAAPRVAGHDGTHGVLLGLALGAVVRGQVRVAVASSHVPSFGADRAGWGVTRTRANGAVGVRDIVSRVTADRDVVVGRDDGQGGQCCSTERRGGAHGRSIGEGRKGLRSIAWYLAKGKVGDSETGADSCES